MEYCLNITSQWENVTSITRMGPEDTSIPSVTFKDNPDIVRVVDKVAEASLNIPNNGYFLVLIFSGHSNWTFFEEPNFGGHSICWRSTEEVEARGTASGPLSPEMIKHFGSAIRSCDLSLVDIARIRSEFVD